MVKVKILPSPTTEETLIVPPNPSTSLRTVARPIPDPCLPLRKFKTEAFTNVAFLQKLNIQTRKSICIWDLIFSLIWIASTLIKKHLFIVTVLFLLKLKLRILMRKLKKTSQDLYSKSYRPLSTRFNNKLLMKLG